MGEQRRVSRPSSREAFERLFDEAMPLAVEAGYVERSGEMVRLTDSGRRCMVELLGKEPQTPEEIAAATALMFAHLVAGPEARDE